MPAMFEDEGDFPCGHAGTARRTSGQRVWLKPRFEGSASNHVPISGVQSALRQATTSCWCACMSKCKPAQPGNHY